MLLTTTPRFAFLYPGQEDILILLFNDEQPNGAGLGGFRLET